MKRRIFIAIDLPSEVKERVAETIREWRWIPVRWLPPENWHVTLIPPAYLEDLELAALEELLRNHRLGGAITFVFSRIIFAPPGTSARMIWLEGETPAELPKLKQRLETLWAAERALPPLKPETRPVKLHVTLARFEPGELRELSEKTKILGEVDFRCEVGELTVFESQLKQSGAEYTAIASVPL